MKKNWIFNYYSFQDVEMSISIIWQNNTVVNELEKSDKRKSSSTIAVIREKNPMDILFF